MINGTEIKFVKVLHGENGEVSGVAYTNHTEFFVQTGKGKRGAYKTRWRFVGNLNQAVLYYNGINIGNGYKKRLLAPGTNMPIIARAWSES